MYKHSNTADRAAQSFREILFIINYLATAIAGRSRSSCTCSSMYNVHYARVVSTHQPNIYLSIHAHIHKPREHIVPKSVFAIKIDNVCAVRHTVKKNIHISFAFFFVRWSFATSYVEPDKIIHFVAYCNAQQKCWNAHAHRLCSDWYRSIQTPNRW